MTFSLLTETPLALLVVGLGGGSLPLFVHDHFPKSRVDAVEIDPSMLEVATRWFGFSQSDRMKVHIADGLAYITSLAGGEGTAGGLGGLQRSISYKMLVLRLPDLQGSLEFPSRRSYPHPVSLSPCVHLVMD